MIVPASTESKIAAIVAAAGGKAGMTDCADRLLAAGFTPIDYHDVLDGLGPEDLPLYIATAWGPMEVTAVQYGGDGWVYCGKANAGFGQSFCVHYGTRLYFDARP